MSGIVGSKFNIRGSGLVGSLGTDGQHFLSSGAGKTNVFETVSGGGAILQMKSVSSGTEQLVQSTDGWTYSDGAEYTPLTTTFTPTLSGSALMIDYHIKAAHSSDYCGIHWLTYNHSGISETAVENDHTNGATHTFDYSGAAATDMGTGIAGRIFLSLATTNEVTFKNYICNSPGAASGTIIGGSVMICRTYTGNGSGDSFAGVNTFTVTEIADSISTHSKGSNINGD
jgi:hypothetical protein